jgi:hypothetical protein
MKPQNRDTMQRFTRWCQSVLPDFHTGANLIRLLQAHRPDIPISSRRCSAYAFGLDHAHYLGVSGQ